MVTINLSFEQVTVFLQNTREQSNTFDVLANIWFVTYRKKNFSVVPLTSLILSTHSRKHIALTTLKYRKSSTSTIIYKLFTRSLPLRVMSTDTLGLHNCFLLAPQTAYRQFIGALRTWWVHTRATKCDPRASKLKMYMPTLYMMTINYAVAKLFLCHDRLQCPGSFLRWQVVAAQREISWPHALSDFSLVVFNVEGSPVLGNGGAYQMPEFPSRQTHNDDEKLQYTKCWHLCTRRDTCARVS